MYSLLCYFRLSQLRILSLDNNELHQLPLELCAVSALEELYVANNELTSLPVAIGCLTKLCRLHVQKNKLRELPEVLVSVIRECVFNLWFSLMYFSSVSGCQRDNGPINGGHICKSTPTKGQSRRRYPGSQHPVFPDLVTHLSTNQG